MSAFHGKYLLIENNSDFIDALHREPRIMIERLSSQLHILKTKKHLKILS